MAPCCLDGSAFETVNRTTGVSGTRTCPVCGGENVAARELCGRCGVDLETGVALPTPALSATSPPVRRLRRGRRWWIALVALVVVAVGVVLGLAVAGVGPFSTGDEAPLPEVAFEPATSATPVALPLSSVATLTSATSEGSRAFTADHLGDEDPRTAWHSDVAELPEGATEVMDLFLEDPAWVSGVVLLNGDHRDAAAYESTPRIRAARLVLDGGVTVVANLLDLGREPQVIELPEPVLSTAVRIEVLSAVPGGAGTDVAVSEVTVRGFVADAADRELAHRRAELQPGTGPVTVEPA